MKKILSIVLLVMIMFSFTIPFVVADGYGDDEFPVSPNAQGLRTASADETGNNFLSDIGDKLNEKRKQWETGDLARGSAKYFLLVLVAILVYSVGHMIPGLEIIFEDHAWVGVVFSGIVGFLAMWGLKSQDISSILFSYEGMGFALGAGLPFLIMIFYTLSVGIQSENENAAKMVMSRIFAVGLWAMFTVFMGLRIATEPASGGQRPLDIVIFVIAIIMMFAAWKLINWMGTLAERQEAIKADKVARAAAKEQLRLTRAARMKALFSKIKKET